MRKIEKKMKAALWTGKNWASGNTCIINDHGPVVFLHGNRIAYTETPAGPIVPDVDTFKRWPTRTTVSRLRALGIDASIRKGMPCINGEPV